MKRRLVFAPERRSPLRPPHTHIPHFTGIPLEYDWFSDSFRTNPFDQQRVASAASGIPVVEDKTPEMNSQ
jgi:hypothetical protein